LGDVGLPVKVKTLWRVDGGDATVIPYLSIQGKRKNMKINQMMGWSW
jgi:hypothetical protein